MKIKNILSKLVFVFAIIQCNSLSLSRLNIMVSRALSICPMSDEVLKFIICLENHNKKYKSSILYLIKTQIIEDHVIQVLYEEYKNTKKDNAVHYELIRELGGELNLQIFSALVNDFVTSIKDGNITLVPLISMEERQKLFGYRYDNNGKISFLSNSEKLSKDEYGNLVRSILKRKREEDNKTHELSFFDQLHCGLDLYFLLYNCGSSLDVDLKVSMKRILADKIGGYIFALGLASSYIDDGKNFLVELFGQMQFVSMDSISLLNGWSIGALVAFFINEKIYIGAQGSYNKVIGLIVQSKGPSFSLVVGFDVK